MMLMRNVDNKMLGMVVGLKDTADNAMSNVDGYHRDARRCVENETF